MPSVLLLYGVHSSRDARWRMLRDLTDVGVDVQALDLLGHGGRTTGPPPPWSLRDFADDVAARSGPVDLVVVPVHLLAAEGPASVLGESARKALFDALGPRAVEVTSGHSVYRDRPGPWPVTVLAVLAGLERAQTTR